MFLAVLKKYRFALAAGLVLLSWASFQSEGIASGEFVLTDRIGQGSILRLSEPIRPEMDGKTLFFQHGKPIRWAQIHADAPYCKFTSTQFRLGEVLRNSHLLKVRFKNVARTRWFFDHGVELECMGTENHPRIGETEFNRALGNYFQVEKHRNESV